MGADRELLQQMLAVQSSDDLLWIRHGYWDAPTGLLSAEGEGPVVVSGHTPTVSLGRYCEVGGLAGLDEESGRGQIVRLGGEDTAGVPDRIDIDCAAATGSSSVAWASCGSMMGRSSTRTSTRANSRCKW